MAFVRKITYNSLITTILLWSSSVLAQWQGPTFPDTVQPSATNVVYTVHYYDIINSGRILDTQSLYPVSGDILTFRGDAFRSAPFTGKVSVAPTPSSSTGFSTPTTTPVPTATECGAAATAGQDSLCL